MKVYRYLPYLILTGSLFLCAQNAFAFAGQDGAGNSDGIESGRAGASANNSTGTAADTTDNGVTNPQAPGKKSTSTSPQPDEKGAGTNPPNESTKGSAPAASDKGTSTTLNPLHLVILNSHGRRITFGQLEDRLLKYDIVCIGEKHDSLIHHRIQWQIIKALYARDENIAVGMEMFQKPYQNALDMYIAGKITEEQFLRDSQYKERWGFDWNLYRPIVDFCRRNQVPLGALNAPSELTRRVAKVGYANLTQAEQKELGPIDFSSKAHRRYWFDQLSEMHGHGGKVTPEQQERSYQVMVIWDDFMARRAAQLRGAQQRLVILAGDGHIERRFGIPERVARYSQGRVATIGLAIDDWKEATHLHTDFIILVKAKKAK